MSVHVQPKKIEINIRGANLDDMQWEAERQMGVGFGEKKWKLIGIDATLDMVSVGVGNEWLPGEWRATFTAAEVL